MHHNLLQKSDQHCTCPFSRQIIWNPALQWTTLKFGEIPHKNNIIALIKFYTLGKRWYNFRNAYNKYSLTDRRINTIESIYICDISSTTAHKIAGFYTTFPGLNETI